jgi:hypothetical protein
MDRCCHIFHQSMSVVKHTLIACALFAPDGLQGWYAQTTHTVIPLHP